MSRSRSRSRSDSSPPRKEGKEKGKRAPEYKGDAKKVYDYVLKYSDKGKDGKLGEFLDYIHEHKDVIEGNLASTALHRLARIVLYRSEAKEKLISDSRYMSLRKRIGTSAKKLKPTGVSNILWAMGSIGDCMPDTDGGDVFQQVVARGRQIVGEFEMMDVAFSFVAHARHLINDQGFFDALSKHAENNLDKADSHCVAELLWALVQLELPPSGERLFMKLVKGLEESLDQMASWDVSSIFFMYATTLQHGEIDLSDKSPDLLSRLVDRGIDVMEDMAPRGLLQTVWSLSVIGSKLEDVERASELFAVILKVAPSMVSRIRTTDSVTMLVNLGQLHLEVGALMPRKAFYSAMNSWAVDLQKDFKSYKPDDIADVVWTFATVGFAVDLDILTRAAEYLSTHKCKRETNFANSAWAFGALFNGSAANTDYSNRMSKFVVSLNDDRYDFKPVHIVDILCACCALPLMTDAVKAVQEFLNNHLDLDHDLLVELSLHNKRRLLQALKAVRRATNNSDFDETINFLRVPCKKADKEFRVPSDHIVEALTDFKKVEFGHVTEECLVIPVAIPSEKVAIQVKERSLMLVDKDGSIGGFDGYQTFYNRLLMEESWTRKEMDSRTAKQLATLSSDERLEKLEEWWNKDQSK